MASTSVGRASAGDSPGASSKAAAFRGDTVAKCETRACCPCPTGPGGIGRYHYHPVDPVARTPILEVALWSRRKVEEKVALARAAAAEVTVPEERRSGKRKGKGKGQSRAKAPKTKGNEISEEAKGGGKGKGKGNGKRKVPRAAAEEIPKKLPRVCDEFQAVLPPWPPLGARPRVKADVHESSKPWGAPSEEDKAMDLFTAQLFNEFRADTSEDEVLEALRVTEGMGIGYRRFTHARANLAQKVADKAQATAAAAASLGNALSMWAKATIAGALSISKSAVAVAASAEAFTSLSGGGAPSAAVPSAETSAVASSGASSSGEAADASTA